MRKVNIVFVSVLSILFIASIFLYSFNITKIKSNKNSAETLKIQLESLKSENDNLIKVNSELNKKHSNTLEKVNNLKNIVN